MSDTIIYEHPLNEKIRSYLRIEYLAEQIVHYRTFDNSIGFKPFFDSLFSLAELVDRGEIKKELIRDLEFQKNSLKQWLNADDVDKEQLTKLLTQIESFCFLPAQPIKAQLFINNDPLLRQVKNKLALPGGGCHFDTPLLHYWQHLPPAVRQKDIECWIKPFQMTVDAVRFLLHLLRESVIFEEKTAFEGFFQSSCDKNQLLIIKLKLHQGCYPNISGYRNRYAIRFASWNEQPIHDIKFALACC